MTKNNPINPIYGIVFADLRKKKGISRGKAAIGILSYSQLSRFENGEAITGIETFHLLLRKINVRMDEYETALNQAMDIPDEIYNNTFGESLDKHDISAAIITEKKFEVRLQEVKKRLKTIDRIGKLKNYSNLKHNFWYISTNALKGHIHSVSPSDYEEYDEKAIFDYLSSVELFTGFELWLLSNATNYMDDLILDRYFPRVKDSYWYFKNNHFVNSQVVSFLVNMTWRALIHNHFENANKYIQFLESIDRSVYNLFFYIEQLANVNELQIKTALSMKERQKGLAGMQAVANMFDSLGLPHYHKSLLDDIKRVKDYLEDKAFPY